MDRQSKFCIDIS